MLLSPGILRNVERLARGLSPRVPPDLAMLPPLPRPDRMVPVPMQLSSL